MPRCAPEPSQRRGRVVVAVGVLALVPLFGSLGSWQLDRAAQREVEAARVRERVALPPVVIDGALQADERLFYRRATVHGRFAPNEYLLLDGRKQDGHLGYHLLVPLQPTGGERRLLVNRGWQAVGEAVPPGTAAEQTVEGVVVPAPLPALRLPGASAGVTWPYLDLERFSAMHGYPVFPFVLLADPRLAGEAVRTGLAAEQKWGMHIGYAVQWFAFAAIALLLSVVMLYRPREAAS